MPSAVLPSTSVSSRYRAILPTSARQTADGDLVAGEVDRHAHAGVGEPERLGVHVEGALLLPAVGVELLVEVALGVQQPDADQRHAEVGGRLEVVAGEHAEAAGVLRQGLGDAELRREVGDRAERRVRAIGEPRRPGDRRLEPSLGGGQVADDRLVLGEGGEALRRRRAHHVRRVGVTGGPAGPDPLEQAHRLAVPRPVEVGRQPGKGGERFRDRRADLEPADRSHSRAG